GAVHQPVDLALGEIAPLDCQVYDAWGAFLGCRFHADKPCLRVSYCIDHAHFLHSWRAAAWSASRWQCRMAAPGRVRGMAREEPRGQRHFVLPANLYMGPRGGDFLVLNFHPGPIP